MTTLTWEDIGDTPDRILSREEKEKIAAEANAVLAEKAKVQYIEDRQREYPPLAEQLDYIYHNGVEAWKTDIIDPIKARYPKP